MDQEKNHKIDRFEYSEDDFIGKGAFGKVYKGTDTDSGEKVAIKSKKINL